MKDWYVPPFRYQIGDPTTDLDGKICTLEAGAMALEFETLGGVSLWGGDMVPYCGKSRNAILGLVPKVPMGTNLDQVDAAWHHWGKDLIVKALPWASVIAAVAEGRAVVLQGLYAALGTYRASTFTGSHAMIVLPKPASKSGWSIVGDPLRRDYIEIPDTVLRAFAETLAQSERHNVTQLFFAVTTPHIPEVQMLKVECGTPIGSAVALKDSAIRIAALAGGPAYAPIPDGIYQVTGDLQADLGLGLEPAWLIWDGPRGYAAMLKRNAAFTPVASPGGTADVKHKITMTADDGQAVSITV